MLGTEEGGGASGATCYLAKEAAGFILEAKINSR
jgi:hypothetical protein